MCGGPAGSVVVGGSVSGGSVGLVLSMGPSSIGPGIVVSCDPFDAPPHAQAVEMHESTISRVTTQKYLHSPRGIFELKYFFSSHVNTEGGGEASSTAIRALVKKLIAAENPAKPLSDSKLTTMLSDQGIMVARRTVAKYRESLSIPPSNQRKQLV